jgi:hypothetical protein
VRYLTHHVIGRMATRANARGNANEWQHVCVLFDAADVVLLRFKHDYLSMTGQISQNSRAFLYGSPHIFCCVILPFPATQNNLTRCR